MATGGVREVGVRIKVGADGLGEAEKLSRSLKDLGTDTQELDNKATELGAELAKLGAQQQLIDNFKRSKTAAEEAARALQEAQEQAQKLGREFGAAEEPTKRQATALQRAREEVNRAKTSYTESTVALQGNRKALSDAGLSSDDLANAQVRVRKQTADTQQQVTELTNRYRAAEGVARLNAEQQQRLARETTAAGTAAQRSAGQQAAAGQQVANSLEGVQGRLTEIGRLAAGGVLGIGGVQFLQSVTQTADAFNSLRARMQLVTGEGPALNQALEGVEQIALRTGANLENTGNLFARVLTAGRELGLAQTDALALTESINQAVAVSGASAAASDAALTQLIQGLQSGVLRGEEFNSVIEQAPRLAQALADGLGVTRGELRGLANDGELSAQRVIQALTSQRETLQREFESLPQTVGRAVENLNTSWTVFIGNLDRTTGFTATVASGIESVAQNIDALAGIAGRAGTVIVAALAVQAAGAVRQLAAQAAASAGSFALLLTNIEKIPKTVNIAIAVTGFEVGFQIGELLRENSSLARQLGVAITEFFTSIARDLQFVAEAGKALFTDDTVEAAFDRLLERAKTQREIFAELYADARRSPAEIGAAASEAQAQLEATAQAAKTTGGTVASAGRAGAQGVSSIGQAADGAAGAIADLVAAATQKLPAAGSAARQAAQELGKIAQSGEQAARLLAERIPEAISKLSGAELSQFSAALQGALTGGERQAKLLEVALNAVGRRAAEALGVDVAKAARTTSEGFKNALDNLSELVRALPALKREGLDTGRVVADALTNLIDSARSQSEFEALRQRILALGKAGEITKPQVEALMTALTEGAKEASKGLDELGEAYKRLGVTSKAELDKTAADNKRAWELIKADATASVAVKQAAFTRYADSAIAANGGVADSTIKAEAQSLKLAIQADKTGNAIVTGMEQASQATEQTKKKFNELGQEINDAGEAINQLAGGIEGARTRTVDLLGAASREARNAAVPTGPSAGSFGELLNNTPSGGITRTVDTGQAVNRPSSGEWTYSLIGFSVAGRDANGNTLAGGWKRITPPRAITGQPFGGLQQVPFGGVVPRGSVGTFGPAGAPPFGSPPAPVPSPPAPAPRPTPAPAPEPEGRATPSGVIEIRLTGPNGRSATVTAASQGAAADLAALLEDAFRANGGSLQ
jgi:tape measure domain-containing protein